MFDFSKLYENLKDLQSFSAALVAFAAAGLTIFIQRSIAQRQGDISLRVAANTLVAQAKKDNVDEDRRRLAFALKLDVALLYIKPSLIMRKSHTKMLRSIMEAKNLDHIGPADTPPSVDAFSNQGSIFDEFIKFIGSSDDLRLVTSVQMENYYRSLADFLFIDRLMDISVIKAPLFLKKEVLDNIDSAIDVAIEHLSRVKADSEKYVASLKTKT